MLLLKRNKVSALKFCKILPWNSNNKCNFANFNVNEQISMKETLKPTEMYHVTAQSVLTVKSKKACKSNITQAIEK